MKSSYCVAGGIFGLVLLGGLVSAGVFVAFGTELAIYAALAIVPMLVIISGLWVRRTISTAGTDQVQYTKRRAREVGNAFTEFWKRRSQIAREYPRVFGDGLGLGVDSLIADLNNNGIEFDPETGSYSLGSVGELEEINRLGDEIDEMNQQLESAFVAGVRDEMQYTKGELDRLNDLTPDTTTCSQDRINDDSSWREAGNALDECRDDAIAAIDTAADSIQNTVESTPQVNREEIESLLSQARADAGNHDFTGAVTTLLEATDRIKTAGESQFSSQQRDLQSILDTMEAADVDEYLSDSILDDIQAQGNRLEEADGAIDMDILQECRNRITSLCVESIRELEAELAEYIDELESADLPGGFYTIPEAYETDYAERVQSVDDLAVLEQEWRQAADELADALSTTGAKVNVLEGYAQIRDQIETELQTNGRVDASALPVRKHEEEFLGLYARKNPDVVEFDISEPALELVGATESYSVDVTVKFERGGPERTVEVALRGDAHETSKSVDTPLVSTVSFEEVPFGTYTVSVIPDVSGFEAVEEEVQITEDSTFEFELTEMSLREQLCDELDIDPEQYLGDLEDAFFQRFEDEGFLGTDMSFRVDSDYVPCLLVTWAEQENLGTAKLDDGRVIVYDGSELQREIENVIQYNLDEGGSMSFDELRDSFLSAPVPNDVVEHLVVEGNVDGAMTEETKIVKPE